MSVIFFLSSPTTQKIMTIPNLKWLKIAYLFFCYPKINATVKPNENVTNFTKLDNRKYFLPFCSFCLPWNVLCRPSYFAYDLFTPFSYRYLMYIVHDKAIPQPLSSFNCGIKTEILSNFRPIPTARFKFTLVLFETDDVIISCTIMCCLRNILWWVKWCQKYHLKYKSRDILIKTKSNQFVEDNYRLPQRMAFTLTSSNCKVKIARFCEFLFTLGWG